MVTNENLAARFTWIDYVVLAIMLLVSGAIGLYYALGANRQKTAKDILVANRSMGILPVTLSLLASLVSAPAILGVPAEVYLNGTSYVLIIVSLAIAIPISAHVYLPMFYDLGVTSSFEYLEKRFNKSTRNLASITFIINTLLFLSIVTYVPALALSQVTGIYVWTSIAAIGVVCIIYTSVGGIKGVMWTDVFQMVVMFAALLFVLIKGVAKVGGFKIMWEIAREGNRMNTFNFSLNPFERHTILELTIGGSLLWIAVYGTYQTSVQRYLTSPSKCRAQIALWLNLPGQLLFILLNVLIGLVLYSYYWACDPLTELRAETPIQLLPLFVMEIMSDLPGLPGVFVAGLFSSSLSTLSSGLNALAAVTFEDFVLAVYKPKTEEIGGYFIKIIALGYGVLSVGLIILLQTIDNIYQAVFILFGAICAPLLGVFTLGMMFPCANSCGAVAGFVCGNVLTLWLSIGTYIVNPKIARLSLTIGGCNSSNISLISVIENSVFYLEPPDNSFIDVYKISYLWYSAVGVVTVLIVGLCSSLLTGGHRSTSLDSKLLFCPVRKLCDSLCQKQMKTHYCVENDGVYTIENNQIQCEKFVYIDGRTSAKVAERWNSAFENTE